MAVVIPLVTDFDGRGIKKAEKAFGELKSSASNFGKSLKSVLIPATAAVAGFAAVGFSSVKAAMEDEKAQAILARQLQKTTGATAKQVKATEDWISKTSMAVGVADDELRPALGKLVRVTGSVGKSQKLLRIALDVSKGSGKSLDTVVTALSRAYGGNVKALAKVEPSMKSFITKTTSADDATRRLAGLFEGAAQTAAGTLQGKFEILKIRVDEAKESIGTALLPIADKFASFVNDKMIPYVQDLADTFREKGLGGALSKVMGDVDKAQQKLTGFQGFLVNLTITVGLFVAAFKITSVLAGFVTFFGANGPMQTALSSLGGVFTAFASASIGTIITALGLAATGVFVLVDALRDPIFRQQFGTWILDSLKLIGNAFILVHNTLAGAINEVTKLVNRLLPKAMEIPLLKTYGYMDFSKLATQGTSYQYTNPRQFEQATGNVVINVSGGDPQAVVDTITRWYRQNGPNAPWMS